MIGGAVAAATGGIVTIGATDAVGVITADLFGAVAWNIVTGACRQPGWSPPVLLAYGQIDALAEVDDLRVVMGRQGSIAAAHGWTRRRSTSPSGSSTRV